MHASPVDNPLAGGVIQVVHTTSPWVREMYPAESTSMLSPRTRSMLAHAGHSAREFGPSTTRVVGTLPGMKPDPDPSRPQLPYLLPAMDLLNHSRANPATSLVDNDPAFTFQDPSLTALAPTLRHHR